MKTYIEIVDRGTHHLYEIDTEDDKQRTERQMEIMFHLGNAVKRAIKNQKRQIIEIYR